MSGLIALLSLLVLSANPTPDDAVSPLEALLRAEKLETLTQAVSNEGNALRGSRVFYRSELACAKCHEGEHRLGPDLSKLGKDYGNNLLIESILNPSQTIKPEHQASALSLKDGTTLVGLISEETEQTLVLRDSADPLKRVTIKKQDIEERTASAASIMPTGLSNVLGSRQEFLDLVRYLREIADHGPDRARELRPDPATLAPKLPEYERDIDHSGMIKSLGRPNYRRGEAIYSRVCVNCHGTKDALGSMPTSLRFSTGAFKNGSDPYSIYQTLTRGSGLMPPQTWMVPSQKYDVIHYLREHFLKNDNPAQYAQVGKSYLAKLPKGQSQGPAPSQANVEPWVAMDYGSSLMLTLEVGSDGSNFAHKGIAVRLDPGPGGVSRGRTWMLYDHDTMRLAAAWSGQGFMDWRGINFNGQHAIHPRVVGQIHTANANGVGWADPATGSFADPRSQDRDDKRHGPLPKAWLRFLGVSHWGSRLILSYSVGNVKVLESPGLEEEDARIKTPLFSRTLEIGASEVELLALIAPATTHVCLVSQSSRTELIERENVKLLRIKPGREPALVKVVFSDGDIKAFEAVTKTLSQPLALSPLTQGGPRRFLETLETRIVQDFGSDGSETRPFGVDVLTHPASNPWNSRMRLSGFDFDSSGDRAVVCDWDGDVWQVTGLKSGSGRLFWRRLVSGLFQPLGLKIVDGQIYVSCRDQIAILRDQNGDGETDFVECFNSDHQVTEHFHEFAMDLQTDAEGRFYYAKGARHALKAVVPHHGTLLRVAKDGSGTEILATGFRAPNGVCVNGDGTYFVTDQEGFWLPKNRINLVRPGGFYGNMWGYHQVTDSSDSAMEPPVCWITNAMDRSPAQILPVPAQTWGPLAGSTLSLSYGYGKIFVVPYEKVRENVWQGGVSPLPIPQFPTGVMRGRFHPQDHHLYACGLFAWAGNQEQPGGFYRIRWRNQPIHAPIKLIARPRSVKITLSDPIDPVSAKQIDNYAVKVWSLKRSQNYGSPHINERSLKIQSVNLDPDGKTVILNIPDLSSTMSIEIQYALKSLKQQPVLGTIHGTIH